MRKTGLVGILLGLLGALILVAAPSQATNVGDEGCTPGYWKNHTENWFEKPGDPIDPNMLLTTELGPQRPGFAVTAELSGDSFITALSYKGGPTLVDAERILMRHAVAAWLNAAHEDLGYPYQRWAGSLPIVPTVNAAIASQDRDTMLSLKDTLEKANMLGCPLN